MSKSTYCSIGLASPKYGEDLEIMFRTAHSFEADSIFLLHNSWTGLHNPDKATRKAGHYPPYAYLPTVSDLKKELLERQAAELVLVETRDIGPDTEPLEHFSHPERAVYLLNGRDSQFSTELREMASSCIRVSADHRMTPGVAGAILLYDRHFKRLSQGRSD